MIELLDILRREIRLQGPITLARYMDLSLNHPHHGYYSKQDPLGRAGTSQAARKFPKCLASLSVSGPAWFGNK